MNILGRCPTCAATLISKRAWRAHTLAGRDQLRAQGIRPKAGSQCHACLRRARHAARRPARDPIPYTGGWRRRGLVLVPNNPPQKEGTAA